MNEPYNLIAQRLLSCMTAREEYLVSFMGSMISKVGDIQRSNPQEEQGCQFLVIECYGYI